MENLEFLLVPFLMCIVLVGIHCYLGLHVLARGVIFVDLSLAQVAAFGTTLAFLSGYDHHEGVAYFVSLGVTLLAAAFLSYANRFKANLSQEAVIGILYAFASAAVILLIDKLSHGAEHLKHAMVGQLIWVSWNDLLKVAFIYSAVGLIHYFFRKPLLEASFRGKNNWKWDFLFYGLFGVVITSSVQYAGVLLVFSFLIVPAVLSSIMFDTFKSRLVFGWVIGVILSLVGMVLSYYADLPSGAVIVLIFTASPLVLILFGKNKIRKASYLVRRASDN